MRALFISGWGESPVVWDRCRNELSPAVASDAISVLDLIEVDSGMGLPVADRFVAGLQRLLGSSERYDLLCGWSLGGIILLEAMSRNVLSIPSVIVSTSGRFTRRAGDISAAPSASVVRAMRRSLKDSSRATVERFLSSVHGATGTSAHIERSLAFCGGREDALAHGLEYLGEVDLDNSLKKAEKLPPLLFIYGDADQLVPSDAVARTIACCPGAEQTRISGAGHAPMLSHSEVVSTSISDWCTRRV